MTGQSHIGTSLSPSSDSRKVARFASFAAYVRGLKQLSSVPFVKPLCPPMNNVSVVSFWLWLRHAVFSARFSIMAITDFGIFGNSWRPDLFMYNFLDKLHVRREYA